MPLAVSAQNLTLRVGGRPLLQSVCLDVSPGSLCAIVGPSGSGKSTLLKTLCGIRQPSQGRVLWDGQEVTRIKRQPDAIGYVPQDDIVHGALKVEAVLRYAAELRLLEQSAEQHKRRVDQVLTLVGLNDRRRLRVRRLSGGQRKRVSVAVELITAPRLLLLDEPTSGLDPGLERKLMGTLRGLARDERSVILTTHVMESMDAVDQLVVIYDGHLVFAGAPTAALRFFRVHELRLLFDNLHKRTAAAWSAAFSRERRCRPAAGGIS